MIKAEIVAHSLSPQADELISVLCTFPRIILAEVNTHRMLSKNTSSSRAIPFKKMVESVQNNPFIPIAWQKHHSGMQGNEYHIGKGNVGDINYKARAERNWLRARDFAVEQAKYLYEDSLVTKQLCNRLLEPFMWTTMLITGSREGWENFFNLRCPQYEYYTLNDEEKWLIKSKKEWLEQVNTYEKNILKKDNLFTENNVYWLGINKGQAEIHMMDLAEKIYDAMNESTPKQLQAGEWHIPFQDKIGEITFIPIAKNNPDYKSVLQASQVMVSVAMAARTSYTIVGEEKEIDYQKMVDLHDRLLSQDPPHSSPLEHCARAMCDEEYYHSVKGFRLNNTSLDTPKWEESDFGWCNNLKGFIPYRYMIDNNLI